MFLSDSDKQIILKELYDFIDINCIFRCDPSVNYIENFSNGQIAPKYPTNQNHIFQFYLRRLTHNYKMLNYVSALIVDDLFTKIKNKEHSEYFQLCGLEFSSIPLITAIQMYAARYKIGINGFTIKKDRKPYGLFNLIEGIPTDAPVIIVDDIINSGKSVSYCLDVCKYELNLIPAESVFSIVTFNNHIHRFKYNEHIINATSIFSKNDFNYDYDPEKYWLPKDCDRSINKRPDYF